MIGDYRHLVVFQDPGPPIPDGAGGYTQAWTDLTPPTWYVQVEPAPARDVERLAAGGSVVAATPTYVVRGRRHPGVTTATRMIFEGTTYAITGMRAADPHRQVMELTAVEQEAP